MASQPSLLDTERLPCHNDDVVFPADSTFGVNIGNNVDIFMGTLTIDKKVLLYWAHSPLTRRYWFSGHTHH